MCLVDQLWGLTFRFVFLSIMQVIIGIVLLAAINQRVIGLKCQVPWVCVHFFCHSLFSFSLREHEMADGRRTFPIRRTQ